MKFEHLYIDYDDIVIRWNDYCMSHNCPNRIIYLMDNFDYIMKNFSPSIIAEKIQNGNYKYNDIYFAFDANNNLESFNKPDEYTLYIIKK